MLWHKAQGAGGSGGPAGGWDISTASYVQSFTVSSQESNNDSVFFKTDGFSMYIVGISSDTVHQYTLSTAWDISTASYLQGFSVIAQTARPRDVFFKPDGLKMYVMGENNDTVFQYDLSTAWDISTASYVQGFSVSADEGIPGSVFFKDDGTKMFIMSRAAICRVTEYTLSTAWGISTASFVQTTNISTAHPNDPEISGSRDFFFKPDGLKLFILDTDNLFEFDLSTAWDASTYSYVQYVNLDRGALLTGMFFKSDGSKLYDTTATAVSEYDVS